MWSARRNHYTAPLHSFAAFTLHKNIRKESFLINFQPYVISPSEQSAILDRIFYALPSGYDSHRGFMLRTTDGKTYCTLCDEVIELPIFILGHIKTEVHGESVIRFLKSFVSEDRLFELDFISLDGDRLCCNICLCRIALISTNPYKTIMHILNHNSIEGHDLGESGDPRLLLRPLYKFNPILMGKNKQYVSVAVQHKIQCNLCDKQILYDTDHIKFYKNFSAHFTSNGHVKKLRLERPIESMKTPEAMRNQPVKGWTLDSSWSLNRSLE